MKVTGINKKRLTSMLVTAMVLSQIQVGAVAAPITTEKLFNDVKENVWYSEAINKWGQSGIVTGYEDHSFKPQKQVTRAELASIIDRIFRLEDMSYAKDYSDVNQDKWYGAAVKRVSSAGIMNDAGDKFSPDAPATREELAYAFASAYKLSGSHDKAFKDQGAISNWATQAVDALVGNGYMVGMPNGSFAPKSPLTRAEMMVVIDRLTSTIIQEAGTYKTDVEGNLVVNTKDVILKDMTISGNLYLAEGIGTGDIILDHITVKGTVFVEGGGENSIKCNNVTLSNPIDVEVTKPVRIVNTGNKISTKLQNHSAVTLEGTFGEISVPYNVTLKLGSSLSADKLVILSDTTGDKNAKIATIEMTKGAVIQLVVADGAAKITGQGEIKQINENIAGIKTEVKPQKVVTATGVQSTVNVNTSSGSGGSTPSDDSNSGQKPSEEQKPGDQVDETKWQLTWSDEFNGTKVDPTKWDYNNGFLDLNQEKQVYKSENATVANGVLTITAKKEDTVIGGVTHEYSSARMVTKGKYAQKYGKVEVRAKLPLGKSLWPAIWMLPENDEYTGWPTSGEIDIMESRGSIPNQVWGTLHYGEKSPNNSQSGSNYVFPDGESIDGFHTYGIEWQPGEIRWYVDGKLYQTQDNWFTVDPDTGERYAFPAPFDKEFHVILNLALGGWYDGVGTNKEVDPSIFEGGKEHEMQVDYVRFYESKEGSYPEASDPNSKIPELPEDARRPLADGNLIYDNTYAVNGIKDNPEGNLSYGEGFNLLYKNSFGGKAKATVESLNGVPFAKIAIDNKGNQDYSIQLIQQTSLGRGRTYKLSFDAKAEGDRSIQFKVGGDEARGYAVYSDTYKEDLTTKVQHIEKTFVMKGNTDIAARLEFNVGNDSNDVWIGNVKLEEVESVPVVEDFNTPKAPLKNGSLVYNGAFDKGKLDRLTYWNLETQNGGVATMNVPEDTRDLHIQVSKGGSDLGDITLDQRGLKLGEDASYTVTFTAKAEKDQQVNVKLLGEDRKTIYAEHTVDLKATKQKYEFVLNGKGASTIKGRLVFEVGGVDETAIVLDDVSVVESKSDFSDVNIFPLKNGDFSKGELGWSKVTGGTGTAAVTFDEEAKFAITDIGSDLWHVMLAQMNIPFSAGVKYVVSFDASSDIPRDMIVKIEQEGTWRVFFQETVNLTQKGDKYSFEFTMPADGNLDLGFKFLMGTTSNASKEAHTVTIDNVVCEVKDGVLLKSQLKNGQFKDGIDGMAGWGTYVAAEQGAKADIAVSNEALQMAISDLGKNPWEIQLSQKGIKLEKGKTYEVGFKAHSEAATKLKVSVGHEAEDYSYTNYLSDDIFVDIAETEEIHSFRFTMNNDTASNAKLALEAGNQDGAEPTIITLDDIYLTEVPGEVKEEEQQQPGLKNGDFSDGMNGWGHYVADDLGADADITVIDEALQMAIRNLGQQSWQIQLSQKGIKLEKGKTYEVGFKANSQATTKLKVSVGHEATNYIDYLSEGQFFDITQTEQIHKFRFTMNNDTDTDAKLALEAGKQDGAVATTITLDDIYIIEIHEEDVPETITNLLQNGNFENNKISPWFHYTDGTAVANFIYNEGLQVDINDVGTGAWQIALQQDALFLEQSKKYVIKFDAKVTTPSSLRIALQDVDNNEYIGENAPVIILKKGNNEYRHEFTITKEILSNLSIKFQMGFDEWSGGVYHIGENQIIINNVVLYEAPAQGKKE